MVNLLFLVFYPLVMLGDTINSMYHGDFRGFNIFNCLFRAYLIFVRVYSFLVILFVITVLIGNVMGWNVELDVE